MESLNVILDLTQKGLPAFDGLKNEAGQFDPEDERIVHLTNGFDIGAMPEGTVHGKPTVMIAAPLPDGKVVVIETTLALLESAVRAFRAKYEEA